MCSTGCWRTRRNFGPGSEGAHFYVCGDASRMAKDVDAALHRVVETRRGLEPGRKRRFRQTS